MAMANSKIELDVVGVAVGVIPAHPIFSGHGVGVTVGVDVVVVVVGGGVVGGGVVGGGVDVDVTIISAASDGLFRNPRLRVPTVINRIRLIIFALNM